MSEILKENRTFACYMKSNIVSPPESIEDVLLDDYKQMQIGFIYAEAPSFDKIMERLSELHNRFRTLEWKNNH